MSLLTFIYGVFAGVGISLLQVCIGIAISRHSSNVSNQTVLEMEKDNQTLADERDQLLREIHELNTTEDKLRAEIGYGNTSLLEAQAKLKESLEAHEKTKQKYQNDAFEAIGWRVRPDDDTFEGVGETWKAAYFRVEQECEGLKTAARRQVLNEVQPGHPASIPPMWQP